MKLCTTTSDFYTHCNNEFEKIKELHDAGFKYVDFSMYSDECVQFMGNDWRELAKRIKFYADELGVQFVQAHSPAFETLETLDPNENWQDKFNQTMRSIEVCKELEIPMTVVHAGVKRNTPGEQTMELNKKFYEMLLPTMEKTGVYVLVENVGIKDNQGRYYLNSGERVAQFVDYFNHPLLKACWDIGHGNVFGNQYEHITTIGNRLKAIHYNDNDKMRDMHYAPFLAALDNDDPIRALIDIDFKGPFTFECSGTINSKVKAFDKLKNLNNLSLDVVRAYEKALYQTGKYLLTAYDIFEE